MGWKAQLQNVEKPPDYTTTDDKKSVTKNQLSNENTAGSSN